jgi:hypothetical protein
MAKKVRTAKKKARTSKVDQTIHYGVHDRDSGELVVLHTVTVMAGARFVSGAVIQKRVLTCAAQAVGRPRASMRVTASARPIKAAPDTPVDAATEKLQRAETDPRVTP